MNTTNIIYIDLNFNIGVPELTRRLTEAGYSDTEFKILVDSSESPVLKHNDRGSFAVITDNRSRFAANYPNNIVDVASGVDLDKIVKQIVYIFTNFGRDYKATDRVWITSDTHFNHANIIKYCDRPFGSVEEMNDALVENWNSVVGENDKVIHLGDFAFGNRSKVEAVKKRLKGKIDLILGNHDRLKIKDYYDMGFHRVYDRPILYDGFYIMSHAPIQWIKDGLPFYNCFGHVHNMELYKTTTMNSFCCCVERHGYRPIPFSYVKNAAEYMNEHPNTPSV